jgi:hypothetical protein
MAFVTMNAVGLGSTATQPTVLASVPLTTVRTNGGEVDGTTIPVEVFRLVGDDAIFECGSGHVGSVLFREDDFISMRRCGQCERRGVQSLLYDAIPVLCQYDEA